MVSDSISNYNQTVGSLNTVNRSQRATSSSQNIITHAMVPLTPSVSRGTPTLFWYEFIRER